VQLTITSKKDATLIGVASGSAQRGKYTPWSWKVT